MTASEDMVSLRAEKGDAFCLQTPLFLNPSMAALRKNHSIAGV
jgi:hypothetical protein